MDSLLSDPKIAEAVRNPARIFNDRSMAFSRDEQAVIADISETLKRDFAIRRKMLLKRLDVTMQSFVWIEQAEGCENDVRAALDTQRKELVEAPLSYSVSQRIHKYSFAVILFRELIVTSVPSNCSLKMSWRHRFLSSQSCPSGSLPSRPAAAL